MGKRFEGLDRFLPPPPAPEPRPATEDTDAFSPVSRRKRAASRRSRRALRAGISSVAIAVAVTSVAFAVASLPEAPAVVAEPPLPRTATDVSLGATDDSGEEDPGRRRAVTRTRARSTARAPRRLRHRVHLAPRAPSRRATTALPPVAATETEEAKPKAAPRSHSRRADPPPPPAPAPPQTPLFHCISGPGNEHYVTIDRARAGQLSAPNSGWRCSVAGQVYQEPGPGRVAIELDDGTAYVLERREKTEPSSDLRPLYRHWVSYDWYYSDRPADGGLVGYVAA